MSTPQAIDFSPRKTAPTLTVPPLAPAAQLPAVAGSQALAPLKPAEINLIGQDVMARSSKTADRITKMARAADVDDVGKCLNSLLVTSKKYDPTHLKGGFLGLFKAKFQELKNQFATVDQQVEALLNEAHKHVSVYQQQQLDLDAMYDENEADYLALGKVIATVEPRIAWMEQNVPVVDTSDPFSAQHASDWNGACAMAKKKVDDLRRQQQLCVMKGPMIRLMQSNAAGLVDKLGDVTHTTIPALKDAFALFIMNLQQEKGADFAKNVDDLTNQTLKANAEKLGLVTVKVQTELTRSSIDLATLQSMQASTLKAIEDTKRLHQEGQDRIAAELPQIEALSAQLSASLAA